MITPSSCSSVFVCFLLVIDFVYLFIVHGLVPFNLTFFVGCGTGSSEFASETDSPS